MASDLGDNNVNILYSKYQNKRYAFRMFYNID